MQSNLKLIMAMGSEVNGSENVCDVATEMRMAIFLSLCNFLSRRMTLTKPCVQGAIEMYHGSLIKSL